MVMEEVQQLLENRPPLKLLVALELSEARRKKAGHVVGFFRETPTMFQFESQIVTTASLRCKKM